MTTAVERLTRLVADPSRHDFPLANLLPVQIAAANERLAQHRAAIAQVRNRAEATGIGEIRQPADLPPLLFAHTAYKSYPESWLSNARWAQLCKWLGTVAASPIDGVDTDAVGGIDDWLQRLAARSHYVSCSSGTSGKVSMVYSAMADRAFSQANMAPCFEWSTGLAPSGDSQIFICSPPTNNFRFLDSWEALTQAFSAPGAVHRFPGEPVTVGRVREMVVLRKSIAEGAASPGDIAAFEALSRRRTAEVQAAVASVAEALVANRGRKLLLVGMYALVFQVAAAVRAAGFDAKDFNPDNAMMVAGGLKGADLPADYHEQILTTFNIAPGHVFGMYAMQELNSFMPRCAAGRYHVPPWLMLLPLDEAGETLLAPSGGEVEGRAAFFDLSHVGRWGGVISGDKIQASHGRCACGHEGPTVGAGIVRYADLPGGDKISCAGTIDAYVRGAA
jgi:hypothetical protein